MKRSALSLIVLTALFTIVLALAVPAAAQSADEWFDMGYAYYDEFDYENAIACYTNCIALEPYNVDAYHNRALAYEMIYMYDESSEYTGSARRNALADYNTACGFGDSDSCDDYNNLLDY
jgi:tetratricopeptide (TPR) repeat protein